MAEVEVIQAEIIHSTGKSNGHLHTVVWLPVSLRLKVGEHITAGDIDWEVWKLYPNCKQNIDLREKWRRI